MNRSTPADKLNCIVERAYNMEMDDNHVSTSSRKRIVEAFLKTYQDNSYAMQGFPHKGNIHDKFVWVIFDL